MHTLTADSQEILNHGLASFLRFLIGLLTACFLSFPLGILLGLFPSVNNYFRPVLYFFHPLPKTALIPLFILVLGPGESTKIFLTAFVLSTQLIITLRDGVLGLEKNLKVSYQTLGGTTWGMIRTVLIPGILPKIFTGLKLSTGAALASLFFLESFGTSQGLGFFILDAWQRFNYPELYAGILVMAGIGVSVFFCLEAGLHFFCSWQREAEKN